MVKYRLLATFQSVNGSNVLYYNALLPFTLQQVTSDLCILYHFVLKIKNFDSLSTHDDQSFKFHRFLYILIL